jgi:hypothetical protein
MGCGSPGDLGDNVEGDPGLASDAFGCDPRTLRLVDDSLAEELGVGPWFGDLADPSWSVDGDGDGAPWIDDCDDADAAVTAWPCESGDPADSDSGDDLRETDVPSGAFWFEGGGCRHSGAPAWLGLAGALLVRRGSRARR